MSHLQTVRSLAEDMNAIGLDAFDPHIAGLPLEEGKHADKVKADAEESGEEAEESEVEPYAPEVQEAAMTVFQAARPQIDESLIDYEESEFNYDFLNSIAALIESEIEDGADIDDAVQTVAEQVSSTYNDLTLTEDEDLDESEQLDEKIQRRVRKQRRGATGVQKAGIQMRISTAKGGAKIKKTKVTGKQSIERLKAQRKRKGKKALLNLKKRMSARKGPARLSARKRSRVTRVNAGVAEELRNLLSEGTKAPIAESLSSVRVELAEAFDRIGIVSILLQDFFEDWGDEGDQGIGQVMEDLAESALQASIAAETLAEDDFDLEGSFAKVQKFAKVIGRVMDQYNEYALVDGEGNLVEMDDEDDDDEYDDDTEESESGK
jgi:hypothetical protein